MLCVGWQVLKGWAICHASACQVQGHSRTRQLSLGVLRTVLTKSSLWRESDWRMEEFIVLLTLPLTCASLLKPLCFFPPWDAEPQTSHGPSRKPCAQDNPEIVLCNTGHCCHLCLPLCGACEAHSQLTPHSSLSRSCRRGSPSVELAHVTLATGRQSLGSAGLRGQGSSCWDGGGEVARLLLLWP